MYFLCFTSLFSGSHEIFSTNVIVCFCKLVNTFENLF